MPANYSGAVAISKCTRADFFGWGVLGCLFCPTAAETTAGKKSSNSMYAYDTMRSGAQLPESWGMADSSVKCPLNVC
jgi:hypothetical protein